MRALLGVCLLVVLGVTANAAVAGTHVPKRGSVVYKDLRSHAVVEVRNAAGDVVSRRVDAGHAVETASACGDGRFTFVGAPWHTFEAYLVNAQSIPAYFNDAQEREEALNDIIAAHEAWENNAWQTFVTDCPLPANASRYTAVYGGTTSDTASLADGVTTDDNNVVEFRSLAGTVCDGAFACVVISTKGGREADMLFEADLTRYGYQDYWTTDDKTEWDAVGGRYSLSDMATHEFGHFAGLGHVRSSPTLTMFPFIHDGMQTLGLGDMQGLLRRYPA